MRNKEIRSINVTGLEVREEAEGANTPPKIIGYAAIFDSETVIAGMFREVIKPKAFARSIVEKHDVRALIDHDPSKILGRTKAGTLTLKEDEKGLYIEIDPPNTQVGRDAIESITRGDIDQMSFGFIPKKTTWREDADNDIPDLREIEDLDLFDVSPVTFPAYGDTEVSVRSAEAILLSEHPKKGDVAIINDILSRKLDLAEVL